MRKRFSIKRILYFGHTSPIYRHRASSDFLVNPLSAFSVAFYHSRSLFIPTSSALFPCLFLPCCIISTSSVFPFCSAVFASFFSLLSISGYISLCFSCYCSSAPLFPIRLLCFIALILSVLISRFCFSLLVFPFHSFSFAFSLFCLFSDFKVLLSYTMPSTLSELFADYCGNVKKLSLQRSCIVCGRRLQAKSDTGTRPKSLEVAKLSL